MRRLLLGIFLVSLLAFPSVIAPDPYTHLYIVDKFCQQTQNEEAQYCCYHHRQILKAAAMVPDATVRFYFTEGGEFYKLTHNWAFVDDVVEQVPTGDMKGLCFAKGLSLHMIPDAISHNEIVPEMIEKWRLPNSLIHIPTEYSIGVSVIEHHPEYTRDDSQLNPKFALAELGLQENERMYEWMQNAVGGPSNENVQMKDEVARLNFFLGGDRSFYEDGYTPYTGDNFLANLWSFAYKGLGGLVNKDEDQLVEMSVAELEKYWNNNNYRGDIIKECSGKDLMLLESPDGFDCLEYANETQNVLRIIASAIVIIFILWYLRKFIKSKILKR